MPKLNLKALVTTTALSMLTTIPAFSAPNYVVNTHNKKVIQTPHYYEYDASENPRPFVYYWCGHAALKSALATYGIHHKMDNIHSSFLDINRKKPNYYDYNEVGNCKFCVHIKLIEEYINDLKNKGLNINAYYTVNHSATSYFNTMKNAIDNGKVAVSLSSSYYQGQPNKWNHKVGHYFTIHGYREEGGNKFLYLRDPVTEKGGKHTDWHQIPLKELWDNMNKGGNIQSIIIHD